MKVSIQLSDPWDLGESIGWRPLDGELLHTTGNGPGGQGLVRLDEPLEHHGKGWRFFIVSPRYEGEKIATIEHDKLSCNGIAIPDAQAHSDQPFRNPGPLPYLPEFIGAISKAS